MYTLIIDLLDLFMEIQGIHGYEWANNLYHWIIYGHAWIVHDMHGSSLDLN